jgi:hypothetical protein
LHENGLSFCKTRVELRFKLYNGSSVFIYLYCTIRNMKAPICGSILVNMDPVVLQNLKLPILL